MEFVVDICFAAVGSAAIDARLELQELLLMLLLSSKSMMQIASGFFPAISYSSLVVRQIVPWREPRIQNNMMVYFIKCCLF